MNDREHKYEFQAIESKWQARWAEAGAFGTASPGESGFEPGKPKFYVLDMFPYPSGVGLHVGHPLGYIATDIVARYMRMRGYNVLHPMGFDAFGLPAEQFAVEHGVHPRVTTEQNIENMVRQLKRLGLSYDWERRLATIDAEYYRWTQWVFGQLYHSFFDEGEGRARPISELIMQLESGEVDVGINGEIVSVGAKGAMDALGGTPVGARKWYELSPAERAEVLDSQRLAYLAEVAVNWCPMLGTVLANEEVTNEGRSERGNYPVYRRPLKQWMLRITAYAERLADDLDLVDWPEAIKLMQRNWIGRSEGAMVDFSVEGSDEVIRVFTTRPDTLFGATYMVLAPEHPLVDTVTDEAQREQVADYRRQAEQRSDVDRMAESREKTGVFTGGYAINPVNGERIPIWIADYVLMGYGTGAIMAVPAHDARDFEFARTFDLPIVRVVKPSAAAAGDAPLTEAFSGEGVNVNSANEAVSLDGLPTAEAKEQITRWLRQRGLGQFHVQYKLRDWLFSRQRYWGEPFPILHELDARGERTGRTRAVDEEALPVELPEMEDFTPEAGDDRDAPPNPPLAKAPDSWRYVEIDGVTWERELNTMPQWAGSCWYYLRFIDPKNEERFVDDAKERYWMNPAGGADFAGGSSSTEATHRLEQAPMGVDLYVGGAEHAVLHLLYARFWHKVLYDLGEVSTPEPFGRLFNQGYIQAYAYQDSRGVYVEAEQVEQRDDRFFHEGEEVTRSLGKMGKSLKNAVSPDEIGEEYGCDTLRLYEMYLGPLDASKPWNTRDIIGVHRFLQRVWRNLIDESGKVKVADEDEPADAGNASDLLRLTHKTIKRVTDDMQRLSFNTAIAALIELNNEMVGRQTLPRSVAEPFLLMLAPFAPHVAEELWEQLGHDTLVAHADWPGYDEDLLVEDEVEIVVQIMGKVRAKIMVPADADEDTLKDLAQKEPRVAQLLEGKTVRKVIAVPGKLVNIVAN